MAKQQVRKPKAEIATIDCTLITIEVAGDVYPLGFDTANQIKVEPQIETQDAVNLIVKGTLRAQKRGKTIITGHKLTLTNNLFIPELVLVIQGGTIIYDTVETDKIIGYNPPVAGSSESGETFTLCAYTTEYDTAGLLVKCEKISYPNCQGEPLAFGSEDGTFRVADYVITSAPKQGEHPYQITYPDSLPEFVDTP
jgi:hypothetical protein